MHAPRRSPLAAAGWMLAAVASFSLMDAGMKLLSAHYPPLQVTLLRGAASLPFVLVWVLASAGVRSIVPVRWGLAWSTALVSSWVSTSETISKEGMAASVRERGAAF